MSLQFCNKSVSEVSEAKNENHFLHTDNVTAVVYCNKQTRFHGAAFSMTTYAAAVWMCQCVTVLAQTLFRKPQFITQSDVSFIFIIMFLLCDFGRDLHNVLMLYILPLCQRRRLILRIRSTTNKKKYSVQCHVTNISLKKR